MTDHVEGRVSVSSEDVEEEATCGAASTLHLGPPTQDPLGVVPEVVLQPVL